MHHCMKEGEEEMERGDGVEEGSGGREEYIGREGESGTGKGASHCTQHVRMDLSTTVGTW